MNEDKIATQDEQLARIISRALTESGLVAVDKQENLGRGLAAGQVSGEDWRLYIE